MIEVAIANMVAAQVAIGVVIVDGGGTKSCLHAWPT